MKIPIRDRPWRDGSDEHYKESDDWDWFLEDFDPNGQDWTTVDPEDIDFPEDVPQTPLDEHDRRYDDLYSTLNGDSGDEPPY
jgi:hypothetical protein